MPHTHIHFQITITFSEDTSMGGADIGQILTATEVMQSFNFSQSLGQDFRGLLGMFWADLNFENVLHQNLLRNLNDFRCHRLMDLPVQVSD